jgi:ubiquinone/menaquinone biosynthesis C-methylase UbiE
MNFKFLNHHPKFKWKIYHLYRFFYDFINILNKNNSAPLGKTFVGGGNFEKVGQEFFQYFLNFCNIKSSSKILDIGSGMGRMAIPFTTFLDENGIYEGFDVFKSGIRWSQKNITTKFSNFHFSYIDIFNKEYNPDGKIHATTFTFPYPDNYFDVVFATSVFTHLLPLDLPKYFSEIYRVLKPNGTCFLTFLLLNPESNQLIQNKQSHILFEHFEDKYALMIHDVPEHTIAYDENYVRSIHETTNLVMTDPIFYGSWCGRNNFLSFQDIIISKKYN